MTSIPVFRNCMDRESTKELFIKAQSFRTSGDNDKALVVLREIVRRDPLNAEAYSNIGLLLYEMQEFDKAIDSYRESINVNPDLPEVYCNLGTALLSKNAFSEAQQAFKNALSLKKGFLVAMVGLGSVQQVLGDLEGARQYFVEALRIKPDEAEAHFKLGIIMREWDRLDMAESCFRNAVKFKPDHTQAWMGLGETLQAAGVIEESEACFKKVIELDPGNDLARSNLLLSMNYNPAYGNDELFTAHRKWGEEVTAKLGGTPALLVPSDRNADRILRIGYLSADFCRHPVASFLEPVLRNHDPSGFRVYCYSQGNRVDDITAGFKTFADQWRDIRRESDDQVRRMIQEDQIDIMIECTGHMADNRLPVLAIRCAPIQISWIGYPHATGLSAIDYHFGDEITDPVSEDSPRNGTLLRLPGCFCCYSPLFEMPPVSDLPAMKNGFVTFGSLHSLARLNAGVIKLWSTVLLKLPSSRLLIFRTVLNDAIIRRLSDQFSANGIERDRIEFVRKLPEGGHLSLYDQIDIALDTFPWSGHTTACEALCMGVPVVTLYGSRHAGRMVSSILIQLGLDDLIAENEMEFLEIAQRTAQEIPSLQMLRQGLRTLMEESMLCDGRTFTRNLEHEYRKLWMRWVCEGR
jgi:protein O-GlcNAc transferase